MGWLATLCRTNRLTCFCNSEVYTESFVRVGSARLSDWGHRVPPAGLSIEQGPRRVLNFLAFVVFAALFDSTRAPAWLLGSEARASDLFPNFPEYKTLQPYHTKPIQIISNSENYRPFEAVSQPL